MKLGFVIVLLSSSVFAQKEIDSLANVNQEIAVTVQEYKDAIASEEIEKIDRLWMENLYKSSLSDSLFENLTPVEDDRFLSEDLSTDTLKYRLTRLNEKTPFHIEYNIELERMIKSYLKYRKKYYPQMMARAEYYFPFFEEQLAQYEIPLEIKYLAIVESALKPRAKSRVGATGLWQFMYQTGKMFNLKVSSYVDERQDPVKSTKAACKYLEQLYHSFNDWDLALAAYNSGPGNVSKAIRRSGNRTNYWNIRPFLPKETAGYLPAFYATMYIFEYAKEHNIYKEQPRIHQFEVDSIQVKQLLTFQQVNDMVGTDIELLEFLNPSYKLNIVPYVKGRNYKLALPLKDALAFVDNEDKVYEYATAQANEREKPLPQYFEMSQRIRYRVKSGDYLGLIAERHGVYVRDLKKWNTLRSTNLKVGQYLTIYPKRLNYTVAKPKPVKKITKIEVPKKGTKTYHTVVNGDSLWDISKKYNVTVTAVRSWNNLWGSNNLKLGNQLVIYEM
ncbi:membrane-bound lytic murein transglycosylase D [Wenyingzhuangia heitensis]|uniref:Membrane-bound lytic murein transglycosylase D n=1 Tax=Wenyingzhuangia heitensis TaxID=1487859 RepID=A0ABX0U578_9FLAO|nr:transglycosylase SLT domain-containing protein [Wenyingzhuangia heitensis]NIJ44017.1 membrane-bound lytic murein transglycosylase D [Wenyingzhuangia heitensis]